MSTCFMKCLFLLFRTTHDLSTDADMFIKYDFFIEILW